MRADELLRHRYFVSDQIPASSLPRKYSATNADYRNTRKCHWANQFTKRIRGALRATGIKRKLADRWRANFLIFCAALQSVSAGFACSRDGVLGSRTGVRPTSPGRELQPATNSDHGITRQRPKRMLCTQDLQNLLAWATR